MGIYASVSEKKFEQNRGEEVGEPGSYVTGGKIGNLFLDMTIYGNKMLILMLVTCRFLIG